MRQERDPHASAGELLEPGVLGVEVERAAVPLARLAPVARRASRGRRAGRARRSCRARRRARRGAPAWPHRGARAPPARPPAGSAARSASGFEPLGRARLGRGAAASWPRVGPHRAHVDVGEERARDQRGGERSARRGPRPTPGARGRAPARRRPAAARRSRPRSTRQTRPSPVSPGISHSQSTSDCPSSTAPAGGERGRPAALHGRRARPAAHERDAGRDEHRAEQQEADEPELGQHAQRLAVRIVEVGLGDALAVVAHRVARPRRRRRRARTRTRARRSATGRSAGRRSSRAASPRARRPC